MGTTSSKQKGNTSSNLTGGRLDRATAMELALKEGAHFDEQRIDALFSTLVDENGTISVAQLKQAALELDPDISSEAKDLEGAAETRSGHHHATRSPSKPLGMCPFRLPLALHIVDGSHASTQNTAWLLEAVGGGAAVHNMTSLFYSKVFQDPHLELFFQDTNDPHAQRLGDWIIQKMGGGKVWDAERRKRPQKVVRLAGGQQHVVHDRSSAHVAAWFSPKRPQHKVGEHFKLDDCRLWMRLMFWSARETGLFSHQPFAEWYPRFLGHFVRVYERSAPQFARDAARWSADAANIDDYLANGRRIPALMGLSLAAAQRQLPTEERRDAEWPYDAD